MTEKDEMLAALRNLTLDRTAVHLMREDLPCMEADIKEALPAVQREALEAAGITPDVVCTCDDARTALQWASEGLGTALVPSSILALFPDLSARELDAPELVSSIHLVRKKDAVLSESADLFYRSFRTGQYKS